MGSSMNEVFLDGDNCNCRKCCCAGGGSGATILQGVPSTDGGGHSLLGHRILVLILGLGNGGGGGGGSGGGSTAAASALAASIMARPMSVHTPPPINAAVNSIVFYTRTTTILKWLML